MINTSVHRPTQLASFTIIDSRWCGTLGIVKSNLIQDDSDRQFRKDTDLDRRVIPTYEPTYGGRGILREVNLRRQKWWTHS